MKGFSGVNSLNEDFCRNDNWDRRSGIDRRQFSYIAHIPERRCGEDRRRSVDRRGVIDFGIGVKLRGDSKRRTGFA